MKHFLLFLVLYSFLFMGKAKADSRDDLYKQVHTNFDWSRYDAHEKAAEKKTAMDFLFTHTNYCGTEQRGDSARYYFTAAHAKHTHLVDIDRDGHRDIVFCGKSCPGIEMEEVEIFLSDSGSFRKIFSTAGRIIALNKSPKEGLSLVVYQYPCCAMVQHALRSYRFDDTSGNFVLQSQQLFFNCREEVSDGIPHTIRPPQYYRAASDSCALYWNYDTTASCTYTSELRSPVVALLPHEAQLVALQYSSDGKWAFVRVYYSDGLRWTTRHEPLTVDMKTPLVVYGWVKLRDIRHIP